MKISKPCLAILALILMPSLITTATAPAASLAFLASSAKEKLLSTNVAPQLSETEEGTWECSVAKITTGESEAETSTLTAVIQYEGCAAFGEEIKYTPAEYAFLASGEVHLLKLVRLTIPLTGCEISLPAQAFNKYGYRTDGNNLLLEPLVSAVSYTANSSCSKPGSFKNGALAGRWEIMIPSGRLSFMP